MSDITMDNLIRNSTLSSASAIDPKMHCATLGRIPFLKGSSVCMLGPFTTPTKHVIT
jgi:hypothetical protein